MDKPAQKPDDVNGLLIRPEIISGFFDRRREIYTVPVFIIVFFLFLFLFVFCGGFICEEDAEVIHGESGIDFLQEEFRLFSVKL